MVRAALGRRFGNNPKIEVRAPEEIAALPPGSLDVVVLHSVAQYLTPEGARRVCSSCSAGCSAQTASSSSAISFRRMSRP